MAQLLHKTGVWVFRNFTLD